MKKPLLLVALLVLGACSETTPTPTPPATVPIYVDGKADSFAPPVPTDSREYKVLLDATAFGGESIRDTIGEVEDTILARAHFSSDGDLTDVREERTVRFWDTAGDCVLRNRGFIFRERIDGHDREGTLKFRSASRSLAARSDVSSDDPKAESKFEEDVSPGGRSMFSRSTRVPIDDDEKLNRLGDIEDLYDGFGTLNFDWSRDMIPVGGAEVFERVYGRRELDLGAVDASMSLTLWYMNKGDDLPMIAELSFKYDVDDLNDESEANGVLLFELLQRLTDWTDPDSSAKTALIYSLDPQFCATTP